MSTALFALAVLIAVLMAVNFAVVARGPTIFDRLLGIGAMATNAVLLLVLIGFIYERPDGYLDLAITYAILNFIGVVAIAKYQERGEPEPGQGKARTSEGPGGQGGSGPADGGSQ